MVPHDAVLPTATAIVCVVMCLAVCCAVCAAGRVAVCFWVVLQFFLEYGSAGKMIIMMISHCNSVLQCVAARCRVLQCAG